MVSGDGPMNLWNEIQAFGETTFDKTELALFIESRHKRPFIALRGKARTGRTVNVEGLVIHLLKALKKLGYLDYDSKRCVWSIRKIGAE